MSDQPQFIIGNREHQGREYPFGLGADDLRQHLYIVGKSGTGKTTLLFNLILQAIEAGQGVGIIDPHGDLAQELLEYIPRHRIGDVIYFNPADSEYPISFNILRAHSDPHLVASGIVGALKSIWKESWGPRLEYILYAAVAALAECETGNLLGLQRMLVDARYRAWVVRQVTDPVVKAFWENEFAHYERKFLQDAIAPIQNKVGQLLMSPLIRNIVGQVRSTIDPRFMMDRGRIFIANLSKGALGEDKSNLLGALLVTQFQLAAMSRTPAIRLPKNVGSEREVFTSDEVQLILAAAPNQDWQTLILLGFYLGARLGDCVTMRWDNVDAEKGMLSYIQNKTGRRVVVPMHVHLLRHLVQIVDNRNGEFLCPSLAAKTPGGKHGLSESFKRIVSRAGIDLMVVKGKGTRNFTRRTFHSLRHSFNSLMANAGVSEEVRMRLTGHSSRDVHSKYTHLNVEPLKQAITSLPTLRQNR